MKHSPRAKTRRDGFTLIELLVVIAIITVLLSLLLSAVMAVLSRQADIQNRKEIDDLHGGTEKFHQHYRVYPPSTILLSNDPAQYQATPFGQWSANYLQTIWKKLDCSKNPPDWSGGTMAAAGLVDPNGKYAVVLEGDQCLVFFLGGIPSANPPGCLGFADVSHDPTALNIHTKVQPFFNFLGSRLYQRNPSKHTFLSYKDAYGGQPFVYFSAKTKRYNETDCASLSVYPYYKVKTLTGGIKLQEYLNPDSFQIISAGRDKKFGTATGNVNPAMSPYQGFWDPNGPTVTIDGSDDQSNFSPNKLGLPAN